MTSAWETWVSDQAAAIAGAGRWRQSRPYHFVDSVTAVDDDGRRLVSFASNDYLGLSRHSAVVAAARDALERYGTASGSSRLMSGSRPVHAELEAALAEWKRCDAALLFPTGYAANLGALSTFGAPGTRICSDELNHASIIDGCKLSRSTEVAIYRHADLEHLEWFLDGPGPERNVVVTDTVFSMDGDVAPLEELAEVCARRGALLVIDEAHAVLGPDPVLDGVDHLRVGTLSKTLGSLGGYVAGPRSSVDLLVNRARPFIFTTAPTPVSAAAALAALEIVRSGAGEVRRQRLRSHLAALRPSHPSPIIPLIVGDEATAVAASEALLAKGMLVPAIRPPTVAPGTSRLRISLSAAHTAGHIAELLQALETIAAEPAHAGSP